MTLVAPTIPMGMLGMSHRHPDSDPDHDSGRRHREMEDAPHHPRRVSVVFILHMDPALHIILWFSAE